MTKPRRARTHEPERARSRDLEAELMAVYRDVEAAYSGYSCPGSTECCRFGITGREPYVTSIELLVMRRAIARRGGQLPEKRRALPMVPRERDDERTCSMLDYTGRCSIYDARPLGCRTFWCHRADTGPTAVERDVLGAFVRRIQELAVRHEHDGERGRPLTRALVD